MSLLSRCKGIRCNLISSYKSIISFTFVKS
jgi:hypothetical protein